MSVTQANSYDDFSYEGKYVTIEYSFKNKDGELLGSSEMSGPFTFCMGTGDAIPGLEEFIHDAEIGETRNFIIPAQQAYGVYDESLEREIPRSMFPESLSLSVGMQLFINNEKVIVTTFDDTHVTVNSNHPLAGVDLYFESTITDVSDEAPEATGCCGGNGGGCGCSE